MVWFSFFWRSYLFWQKRKSPTRTMIAKRGYGMQIKNFHASARLPLGTLIPPQPAGSTMLLLIARTCIVSLTYMVLVY